MLAIFDSSADAPFLLQRFLHRPHKAGEAAQQGNGAKYTRSRRPVKFVYHEEFQTLTEARRREAQVKNWAKPEKENLAKGKRPAKR